MPERDVYGARGLLKRLSDAAMLSRLVVTRAVSFGAAGCAAKKTITPPTTMIMLDIAYQ